jgi:holo-[acyl-carrier protein] synthase
MILGIGTDLFAIDRMRREIERDAGFAPSVFTPAEIRYCEGRRDPAIHFAARFAAKEALVKALADTRGDGSFWRDVEVERRDDGAPAVRLTGRLAELAAELGVQRVHLSLTHTDTMAAASVVLEGGRDDPPDWRRR